MVINFLGDSITAGVGASHYSKCYVELVKSKLNVTVNNYGINGTRIAKQIVHDDCDLPFYSRVEEMDANADLVFVFGGTNDFDHGDAPLGEIDSRNVETFCGGLNVLVEKLISKYGKEKLCFILPLRRINEDATSASRPKEDLTTYISAIKQILEKNAIKYIDTFNFSLPKPLTCKNENCFADGLHPNDKGYEFLSDIVVNYIKGVN